MANDEDVARLRQGVAAWNAWRADNPRAPVNLREADLHKANLREANLCLADLRWAVLSGADLETADLHGADLRHTQLELANLTGANLGGANLRDAGLGETIVRFTDLHGADLWDVHLEGAGLNQTDLEGADLSGAYLRDTVFANVDLSATKGLECCRHLGPSSIDYRTLQRSGPLPLVFLRGCGLPDQLIEYLPSLLGKAIQYHSCFISYSSRDEAFARRLHADLQNNGVRCWFAPEDMKIGDKLRHRIDEAIHVHERLLLILSDNSVSSEWVEKEVETAFDKERRQKRTVLFPIRLDDAVMECHSGWSADIRRTRHIGDFCRWKDHDSYQKAFNRVLRDLKTMPG